jgi:hypothetical protein
MIIYLMPNSLSIHISYVDVYDNVILDGFDIFRVPISDEF